MAASAAPGTERPLPVRLILVLGALSAFGPLSVDMYLPALPGIQASLSTSTSAVQLTLTACTIGLGAGQLVAGPMSDAFGRRRPLLAGVACFAVFSVACALAPSLPLLVLFRFLQALGGSAGLVISRAVARDLRSGRALTGLFALLMAINGAAPILAPAIGGQLVRVTSWRGVFVVLAVIGALLLGSAAVILHETLPIARRRPSSVGAAFRTYRWLLTDRIFVLHVLTGALAFGAMFAYISGSPFVLETIYRLSPQLFSAVFAVNAMAIIAGNLLARRITRRPGQAVLGGVLVILCGAAAVLASALGVAGLPLLLPGFLLVTGGYGVLAPNVTALALADHPDAAGSASAVYGAMQFLLGGALSPLVGVGGPHTALPLAIILAGLASCALLANTAARRRR